MDSQNERSIEGTRRGIEVSRAEKAALGTASLATRTGAGGCLQAATARDLAVCQGISHLLESINVSRISVGIFHTLLPEKVDTGGGVAPAVQVLVDDRRRTERERML